MTAIQRGRAKSLSNRPGSVAKQPELLPYLHSPSPPWWSNTVVAAAQQPHYLLSLPSASSFLLSRCGSNKGCSPPRGVSFICQPFSTTNAYVCVISNSAASSQTILVHQSTGPNKPEHQNQSKNRDALKEMTKAQSLVIELTLLMWHNINTGCNSIHIPPSVRLAASENTAKRS